MNISNGIRFWFSVVTVFTVYLILFYVFEANYVSYNKMMFMLFSSTIKEKWSLMYLLFEFLWHGMSFLFVCLLVWMFMVKHLLRYILFLAYLGFYLPIFNFRDLVI